jgi:twitching motility protein PilT
MGSTSIHQPLDEPTQPEASRDKGDLRLQKYFQAMIKTGASDLHLKPNAVPHIRIRAILHPTEAERLNPEEIAKMADELMTEKQKQFFMEHGNIDVAKELAGSDRFRISIYRQRNQVALAIRRVSREIPDFKTLHLPPVLEKIASLQHGLVLVSGASGSGKSTTIASIIECINKTRACQIVTIEDPIEYLFEDKKAFITQREVGIDVDNFDAALKYLMRQDPDVVLIGEMRDHETFRAALQVAETGHLIFGTVHASSASQTVGRVLDLIKPESREIARQAMAYNLKAIICQKLLPSIANEIDRIPAMEILLMNPSVRQLIEEERESELIEVIHTHEHDGMLGFTKSLLKLIENDLIDPHAAYEVAPNLDELKMMLKGITTSQSGLIGRE